MTGDLSRGFRTLAKNPASSLLAILGLGLGICASVTVFAVYNALLLRPIPGVGGPGELVSLTTKPTFIEGLPGGGFREPLSYPGLRAYQQQSSRVFTELAAFRTVPLHLMAGGVPYRLSGQAVSLNYFDCLRLQGVFGRSFSRRGSSRDERPVVVVSHGLWRRVLGSRSDVLGNMLTLNGESFVVIGVAPEGFQGTLLGEASDLWFPLEQAPLLVPSMTPAALHDPENGWLLWLVGRRRPGIDLPQAQLHLDDLTRRFEEPGRAAPPGLEVHQEVGVRPGLRAEIGKPLRLLALVAGLLMLVICVNLGGLLVTRAAGKMNQIGLRLAVGSTSWHLARHFLAESFALTLAGTACGLSLSALTTNALEGRSFGRFLPTLQEVSLDGRVLAFTAALAVATGLFLGLVPVAWALRKEPLSFLRHGGVTKGRARLQEAFAVAQVALCLVLLLAAGLLARTLMTLHAVEPGFEPVQVLNLRIDLESQRYAPAAGLGFYRQVREGATRLSGARSAALAVSVPLSRGNSAGRIAAVQTSPGEGKPLWMPYNVVSPAYFETLGIALLHGRDFTDQDRAGAPAVVIVNERLARELWPGVNPIGKRLQVGESEAEVVGVVRSIRTRDLKEEPTSQLYLPLEQHYEPALILHVRTASDPKSLTAGLRAVINRLDRQVPAFDIQPFEEEVGESLAQPRILSWLLGSFGAVALLGAMLGLYASLSYSVQLRTRELGIRMALGASPAATFAWVLRYGALLVGVGLVVGAIFSVFTVRFLTAHLFGVAPSDPLVLGTVLLLLGLTGLAATWYPAATAARLDPLRAIRAQE